MHSAPGGMGWPGVWGGGGRCDDGHGGYDRMGGRLVLSALGGMGCQVGGG